MDRRGKTTLSFSEVHSTRTRIETPSAIHLRAPALFSEVHSTRTRIETKLKTPDLLFALPFQKYIPPEQGLKLNNRVKAPVWMRPFRSTFHQNKD